MQVRTVVIATDLGATGDAVFRHEGRVGFIAGLLPGESGEAQLTVKGGVWRGTLLRRLSDAPERIPHPCPHANRCPGSRLGCLQREAELAFKKNHAETTLRKIAGIERELDGIVTAGPEWGYRNKIELSVRERGGTIQIGYHPENDPTDIIPITDCFLADEALRQLLHEILVKAKKEWRPFLKKTERLVLRAADGLHLQFQATSSFTEKEKLQLQEFFNEYTGLVGITTSFPNTGTDAKSDEPLFRTIVGELLLTGHDGVMTHPRTFRQINDAVAKQLIAAVDSWGTGLTGTIFDLYGGFGPFARRLAATDGRELIVIEKSKTAIQDGQRALKKKALPISYVTADVARGFPKEQSKLKPQGILLDPPYSGAGEAVITEILRRKPRKIGYIACHGAALARDLKPLLANGYDLEQIRLFDMFPHTADTEWFAELVRK